MIDILVPVLGRPKSAEPLVQSIHEHTRLPVRVLFICSSEDDEQIEACQKTGEDVMVMSWPAGRSDYPLKMNAGYRDTEGEWILLAADDLEFRDRWDEIALELGERSYAGVVATNDLANAQVKRGRFGTHSLVRRSYVDERGGSADGPGVLMHEGYDHNFCDRELCHLALHRGLFIFSAASQIYHRHPVWRTAPMDATYEKGLSNFKQDQELFLSRAKLWGYEGLSPSEITVARRGPRRRRR